MIYILNLITQKGFTAAAVLLETLDETCILDSLGIQLGPQSLDLFGQLLVLSLELLILDLLALQTLVQLISLGRERDGFKFFDFLYLLEFSLEVLDLISLRFLHLLYVIQQTLIIFQRISEPLFSFTRLHQILFSVVVVLHVDLLYTLEELLEETKQE